MKKKFRKQFHKQFPWYDQEYLLDVMILWTDNAAKMHKERGCLVRSGITSNKLKIISTLLKRLREDEYDLPCKVFISRNRTISKQEPFMSGNDDVVYVDFKYQDAQRKQDKEYVFKFLAKHLDQFWD